MAPRLQHEQAWALRLERAVRYARGDLNGTASLLLDAAGRLASRDSSLARETFLEAFQAALCAGRLAGQARATAAQITADSSGGSQGAGLTHVLSAMGLLEIGLGNYKSTVANLLPVYEEDLTYLGCWSLPDLVEAASCTGDTQTSPSWRSTASPSEPSPAGQIGRSACSPIPRALLARDRDIEVDFQQAIDRLQAAEIPTDLARACLLFGEWLTTEHRGHDARPQLQKAREIFESIGAENLCPTSPSGARCDRGRRNLSPPTRHPRRI